MTHVKAVYENGVFRPTEPVALTDGQPVRLTVAPTLTIKEWEARVDAASTIQEWVELANSCPEPDPEYDILAMLSESRRLAGYPVPDSVSPPPERP